MQTRPPRRPTPTLPTHRTATPETSSRGWSPRATVDGPPRDSATARAADECIALLEQGLSLIEALEDEDYAAMPRAFERPGGGSAWSSPGAHTRHLLDCFDCLLNGIDAQRVDYTARKRRPDVETDREAGRHAIVRTIEGLDRIRRLRDDRPLEVRPEPEQDWTRSTLARELQYVSGHAVHHHALIRMTLAYLGIEAPPEYGVAPSTLAHEAERRARTASDGD